ncbi:MAG TPA: hypothetical protein VLX28_09735 [Thermoanaerobaculia bacterium]|nr:hypothetical protein [Thermoanaerobaculia bacterium]
MASRATTRPLKPPFPSIFGSFTMLIVFPSGVILKRIGRLCDATQTDSSTGSTSSFAQTSPDGASCIRTWTWSPPRPICTRR